MRISSIFSERVRQVLLFAVESASAVAAATCFCAYCRCVLITCICSALVFFFPMGSKAGSGSNACGFVELDSYVRGHHAYQVIRTPFKGKSCSSKGNLITVWNKMLLLLSELHRLCAVQFGSHLL